jgi:hypothetical protein
MLYFDPVLSLQDITQNNWVRLFDFRHEERLPQHQERREPF